MKNLLKSVLFVLLLLPIASFAVLWSGVVKLDAAAEHPTWFSAGMHWAYERAITSRAESVKVPTNYPESYTLQHGAASFAAMCTGCHIGPGQQATATSLGLNPPAPIATDLAGHFSTAQLYSVIDRGVFMTGMPAFGPSHDAEEIWHLTRFVEAVATMEAATYTRITAAPAPQDGHTDHSHGASAGHESREPAATMESGIHTQPTGQGSNSAQAGHEKHDHAH